MNANKQAVSVKFYIKDAISLLNHIKEYDLDGLDIHQRIEIKGVTYYEIYFLNAKKERGKLLIEVRCETSLRKPNKEKLKTGDTGKYKINLNSSTSYEKEVNIKDSISGEIIKEKVVYPIGQALAELSKLVKRKVAAIFGNSVDLKFVKVPLQETYSLSEKEMTGNITKVVTKDVPLEKPSIWVIVPPKIEKGVGGLKKNIVGIDKITIKYLDRTETVSNLTFENLCLKWQNKAYAFPTIEFAQMNSYVDEKKNFNINVSYQINRNNTLVIVPKILTSVKEREEKEKEDLDAANMIPEDYLISGETKVLAQQEPEIPNVSNTNASNISNTNANANVEDEKSEENKKIQNLLDKNL